VFSRMRDCKPAQEHGRVLGVRRMSIFRDHAGTGCSEAETDTNVTDVRPKSKGRDAPGARQRFRPQAQAVDWSKTSTGRANS